MPTDNPSRREVLQWISALGLGAAAPAGCTTDPQPSTDGGALDAGALDAGTLDAGSPEDTGVDVPVDQGPPPFVGVFASGVASGDPLPDGVVLWTHVSFPPGMTPAATDVTWVIASDPALATVVTRGTVSATPDRAFTAKVIVTGLSPGRTYYYRFEALGQRSPVGRTRTAPTGTVARLRFGVVSCASMGHGYFHAYRAVARRADLDAVVHLGDYIYEYATNRYGITRPLDPPHEIVSLEDYRRRYAWYRRDPDLQELHRQHPMIVTWDDHEFADNSFRDGAENHTPGTEGPWADRKAAATRAWREWIPCREAADGHVYRSFVYGDLVDLLMLDTRIWGREEQFNGADMREQAANRQLLGADQERWLRETLTASRARWKLFGQQVMMAPITALPNGDAWDGYPAARRRFFETLRTTNSTNSVVLTGDIHCSWANELFDGQSAPLAVEFVSPSVTSIAFPAQLMDTVAMTVQRNAPHILWLDLVRRGYTVLDVTPERVQSAWFLLNDVTLREGVTESVGAVFSVNASDHRLRRDPQPVAAPMNAPAPAP